MGQSIMQQHIVSSKGRYITIFSIHHLYPLHYTTYTPYTQNGSRVGDRAVLLLPLVVVCSDVTVCVSDAVCVRRCVSDAVCV